MIDEFLADEINKAYTVVWDEFRQSHYDRALLYLAINSDNEWLEELGDPYLSSAAQVVSHLFEVSAKDLRKDVLKVVLKEIRKGN